MSTNLIILAIGLTAGNFFVEAITDCDWGTAAERSFFQIMALLSVWLVGMIEK